MDRLRLGKKTSFKVALVTLALLMCLSVVFAAVLSSSNLNASAATNVGSRVTPRELMSVHNVDWVMGPLATGYTDYQGNATNNAYGIPAYQYFNINNYLYTETSNGEKIVRGWKNNIQAVTMGSAGTSITQDGYIERNGVVSTDLGIYVTRKSIGGQEDAPNPSTNKYMLIMPDDITQIGTGSGAFSGLAHTANSSSPAATGEYANFTDFGFYVYPGAGAYANINKKNYWSPRERLAGVYFNSTSQLKSVNDGLEPSGYRNLTAGKGAFASCDNMKFFVLPDNNKLTTIGNHAFSKCTQLRDINIPSSVTSIGTSAFNSCSSIPHLTIPSSVQTVGSNAFAGMTKLSDVENHSTKVTASSFSGSKLLNYYETTNGSQLYMVGNDENDTGASGYYFCKNVRGYTGTLATITKPNSETVKYTKDAWYVVALAGKDDTTAEVVRRFPKSVTVNDARRSNILYDYLNSDGKKCTNTLSETITKYDIGNGMADSTWCCNVVLPSCVEIIGDKAFNYTHMVYLEMHATTVGANAFSGNADQDAPGDQQHYYIHKAITKYGDSVFSGDLSGRSTKLTRRFIFEDKTLYNTYVNNGTLKTGNVFESNNSSTQMDKVWLYQIPIIANVVSADGDVNIITGDMDTRFDYDADYDTRKSVTGSDANGNGTYKITYTKRLSGSGFGFDTVKTAKGNWTTLTSTALASTNHATPIIEGMESTQWYKSTTYTEANKTTAAGVAGTGNLSVASINIYTKKIAKPTIVDKVDDKAYTFGDDIPSANLDLLDLGVANPNYQTDYVATITAFTFASGGSASTPTSVENAGTYTVAISLNEEKWGKWTDEYQSSFIGTVVVNRRPIDLGDLANIPTFSAGGVALGGEGAGAALYRYADGWYLYPQSGSQIGDTVYANNSYTRYTASEIALEHQEWTLYNISNGSGDHYATASRDYYATFNLSVLNIEGANNETNYEFVYDSESANAELFELYGLMLDNKTTTSATLRKAWYIVMQSNWFIDSTATLDAENPYNTAPYALALKDNKSQRTWTYEDVLDIRMPKLAYNQDYSGGSAVTVSPTFSIVYNGVSIVTDESDLTKLAYYVNPSMPAGTYTVIVSASAIQAQDGENYPAISDSIQIIVTPKALNTTDLQAALQNNGNAYEFPYDMSKHLYYKEGDEGFVANSGVDYELSMLNQTLNGKRAAATDSYWATQAADGYFGQAQITYNLDRMGTSNYSSYDLAALTSVDTYTVYYCISAKNYITIGGENDVNRRDKKFTTLIYNEILVSSLFGNQNDSSEYLQDMVYNGSDRYTSVPYNQLYRSEYTDADYTNARTKVSVTITLLNSQTSRWKYDLTDAEQMARVPRPAEGSDVAVIVAYYDITPAFNSWAVSPQMPSWTFNGFDRDVNVVASGLKFVGADVMYRLGLLDEETDTIIWTHYFKVNANGMVTEGIALDDEGNATAISQADIISELNLLKPGNYYLESKVGDIKVGDAVNVLGGEFVASNGDGMLATVIIAKANNRWTRSPNIVRWTWGEYNSARHVISSTSLYPSVLSAFFDSNNIDTPVAEYQIWKYVDLGNGAYSLEAINGLSGEDFWFTVVNGDIASILGGLDAGDYVLRARLSGTDYYTDIDEQESIFDIARATNSWKYSPNVVRWDWSNYNQDINVITATPVNQPNGAVVHYTILNGKYELADAALRNFTEVTEQIAGVLAKLPAGDYYLVASLEGTDNFLAINDWDTITGAEKSEGYVFGSAYDFADTESNKRLSPIQFSIGKISNAWVITPGMTGWQYKEFVSGNFIFGEPKNTPTDKTVKYTVTKLDNTKLFDLEYGVNEETGAFELTGASVAALKALTVGNYQLSAALDGTTDYSPLDYSTTFSVIKANNTWDEYPGMTSWQYKGFAVSTNFTAGVPANKTYNGANENVATYTVSRTVNDETETWTFYSDSTASYIESLLQALTVLDGSRYTMKVEYPGDSNYNKMEYGTTFEVIRANNSWTTTPALAGWQYSYFAESNFREGVPALNDANKAISYVITKSGDANVNITLGFATNAEGKRVLDAETVKALKALDVSNDYVLKVTLEGTTNYSGITNYEIGFSVSAASTNAWTAIPSISGWTYKQFVSTLLTEGKAQFGTVTYTVYKGNDEVVVVVVDGSDVALENLSATDLVTYLALLNANDYVLFVEAAQWTDDGRVEPEDADYAYATRTLRFTVSRANDTWATYPSMAGWTYGNAVGALTEGKPTVKTGAVSYEYYKAKQENGEWVPTGDAIKELTSTTPAGNYVLVATVKQGTNYNELTHVVHFVVAKADNNWKTNCEPEDRLDWTWGDYSVINGSKLINAESTVSDSVAYTIVKVLSDNQVSQTVYEGSTTFSQSNIVDVLKTLGSGDYRVTSTVAATDNYDVLTKITSVTVSKAKLTVTNPACSGWTWGTADTNKQFTDVTVSTVLTSDQSKVAIAYKLDGNGCADYSAMWTALKGSNAGTHTVVITVTCENYDDEEKTLIVVIGNADFVWETNVENTSWTWNGLETGDGKQVVEPKAKDLAGQYVVFTFTSTVGSNTTTYASFEELQKLLFKASVGTYTIDVKYELANYNSIKESFTVTVNKAANEWTANAPQASYECEYTNKNSINILQATAKFGTVVYQDKNGNQLMNGSTAITTEELLNAWIQGLGANDDTPYEFYTVVIGDDNYEGLRVKTEILVTGTKSNWANKDYIKDSVNLTFSDSLNAELDTKLNNAIPYGDNAKGDTSYTISYLGINDKKVENIALTSVEAVMDWIKGINVPDNQKHASAGTYTIKSTFVPTDPSYTTLNHTLTVVVTRAKPQWDKTLDTNYYGQYGSIEVPTITVKGYSAPITVKLENLSNSEVTIVIVKDGNVAKINDKEIDALDRVAFAEYVKTLNAVTTYYAVSYSVEATDNYEGLNEAPDAKTSRLYISPIVNTWLANTEAGITAADWVNGYTWTFTRGDTVAVTLPQATTGNDSIKITREDGAELGYKTEDGLNSYLATANLPAGTYKLVFTIPQSGNYNGLVSNCQIVISKNTNEWKTELANYNGSGNVNSDNFTLPEAKEQNNLLRFNVVKADGSIIGTGLVLGTGADNETNTFRAILKTLANGTYTVTAYVGGTAGYNYDELESTDPLKTALDKYNADYNMLTSTCTINLTPHTNKWTATLSGQTWTWGEFNASLITEPKADWGNNTIEYTLRKGNTILQPFTVEQYGSSIFTAVTTELGKLNAGTYSLTAVIAGTDIYNAPETLTAVFVVSPVTTAWTLSDTQLAKYEYITGVWNAFQGNELPNLAVANWTGAEIVYAVNGEVVTDTDDGLYGNPWIKALKTLGGAGTYIFTATVNADEDGNHTALTFRARVTATAVQSSWNTATTDNNGAEYNWIYSHSGNAEIAKPIINVAAGDVVTYTLSKRGSTGTLYTGQVWNDTENASLITTLKSQPSGEYIITAVVAGNDNYTALNYSVNVIVSLADNSWKNHMNTANAENYKVEWTFGAVDNTAIVYEAEHNNEYLEFTVDGGKVADLAAALKLLGAGEHAIVASVKADEMYGALSETIKLVINKADNSWTTNLGINGWTWNDISKYEMNPDFVAPVPAQGASAIVTVRNASNAIVLEATLNYTGLGEDKVVNGNDKNALVSKLCALDVGTYSIIVSVGETDNYEALTSETKSFEITKATNDWTQNGAPSISGWNFGGSTAYPSATPQFGQNTVRFSYSEVAENEKADTVKAPIGDHTWNDAPSYTAGQYWLRAYVPGTDNYTELTGYHKFSVNEAENAWVKTPGVVEWSWNGYDKDINLFRGSARSNKPARFTVTKKDGSDLAVSDFNAFGGKIVLDDGLEIDVKDSSINTIRKYLTEFTLDADGKVSGAVANILNALKNGTYKLTVEVDGGESLQAISGEAEFTVSKANNEWTTAPNVLSFDYNGYIASGDRASFTAGESKYGTVSYQITGADNDGKNVSLNNLTIDQVGNGLKALNAGNYILKAWVVAGSTYNAFYSDSAPYQVLFSVSRIANNWDESGKPNTSISKTYTDLHADGFNFNGWFGTPQTIGNDAIDYTLLNTDYTSAKAGTYKYGELFKAIKELDSGEYIVHMAVAQSCNYLALTADTSLSIQRKANAFATFPTKNLSGQWQQKTDDGKLVNNSTLNSFTVTADEGNDTITYTINGAKCNTLTELQAAVAQLDAGSYQVVIAVEQTNDYEGLSRTVQLDIKQGENILDWTLDTTDWTWHSGLERFTAEKPKYGDQIVVEISGGSLTSASSVTVSFPNTFALINQVICGAKNSAGEIVGGLDAGTYTIKVTASASNNWAEISESKTFTIEKAKNAWTVNPALDGTLDNVYSYGYGAAITPSATAQYGTVKYTYYVNDAQYAAGTAEPLSAKPANVGSYVVEISVNETTNYHGITATKLYFDIVKVLNDSFIVSPSAVGWTWGSYDRTVHMFTGIPRSGGNVSFSILNENKEVVLINNIALDKMLLVGLTENGEYHYNDVDKDMFLEKDFAALVAQLKEGNYYLQINVEATTNNTAFTATTPFRVNAAENGWNVTPKIASWSLGLFNDKTNMPQAEPRFGTAHIVVISQNNDEVYYDSKLGINRLENALAGWYMMKVTVAAEPGCYNGLSEDVPVQVYMRGSNETKNYWYESFGINPWEAIVGNIGNKPYGTPLRGLPYFEFYYAKRDANNQLVIDWDRPVEEGPDSYLLPKGDLEYYKDFYVPMAPGDYFMVACAVNVDSEGNVIEADNIRETDKPYPLHIEHRANSFKDDPHIDTLLFLGDRNNWADPTATASLAGSEIWFTYQNADTGEDLGRNKPNAEGKYIVIAHAIATYSQEITKEAKFTVELSTNEWIDIPTMENWSEETEEKFLEWSTKFDADEIVYTYENVDTGEKFNSKPITEGTYKVTATVKKAGYHDLVGTTTFTIEPAYDRDLLRVDIALGVIACALAVFVIIFAIRRYKEN